MQATTAHIQAEREIFMLVLSRKVGEEIVIGGNIRVRIVKIDGNKVRIGVIAPDDISVDRQEIHDRKQEWAVTPAVISSTTDPAILVAL
jgi:carbon storage regulator